MRVMYVWDADYPWDVRTQKVCRALTDNAVEVCIVARNRDWRVGHEELPEGTVLRMPPLRRIGRRLDTATSFPAFFNPRWISHLLQTARRERPDAIIVRDLPLCPTALWVGQRLGLPVILDMAENYPEMLRAVWRAGRQGRFDFLLRNPSLAALVESYCLSRVDHVLVVVEESAERIAKMGVPQEKISVVSNTPPPERTRESTGAGTRGEVELDVVYLGLLEVTRGIGELIRAAASLHGRGVSLRLRIIGDGRDRPLLEQLASDLGLERPVIDFLGYLPNHEALKIVAESSIGVVPHHAEEDWNTTIPNKLFDYMAAGLAVVSSDAAPCVRVLAETGAGRVFRSGDADSLASTLDELRAPSVREALGRAGIDAVRAKYNWEVDSAVLLESVHSFIAPRNDREPAAPPVLLPR